ncbi:MAG: ywqC3 [Haloplasmataceae bacterium]|jgi:capsular polysaccharide biosynthesis protein|nr:ywqC3 [Haloplasmataceae bacterium]
MTNEEMSTIDLRELFHAFYKNSILIIVVTVLFTLAMGLYTKYGIAEKYESKTLISLVSTNTETNQSSDQFRRSVELAKRYSVLSKSETVLKEVREDVQELHSTILSTKDIANSFTVVSVEETDILRITVTYTDKVIAKTIAQSVTEHSRDAYTAAYQYDNVFIIDNAEIINDPVSPKLTLNTLIGLVLGVMVSIGIVLLKEFSNRKIKTQKDIEEYLGISYFGAIPNDKKIKYQK